MVERRAVAGRTDRSGTGVTADGTDDRDPHGAEAALAEFHTGRGYELPGLSIVGVGSNAVVQRGKE